MWLPGQPPYQVQGRNRANRSESGRTEIKSDQPQTNPRCLEPPRSTLLGELTAESNSLFRKNQDWLFRAQAHGLRPSPVRCPGLPFSE
jgi:hypothetical protein